MKSIILSMGALWLSFTSMAQTELWSNNFDDPSQWVVDNDGQMAGNNKGWNIDAIESSWYLDAFNSTSGGNYAELNNGDPVAGSQALDVTYTLTIASPLNIPTLPGNTDATDQVSLEYEQYGALFNDAQLTQISTDGNTWVTIRNNADHHDVLSAAGGSPYPNAEKVKINLAPYITGNASTVSVRFLWTTAFPNQTTNPNVWITYGWGIDDVKIVTNPDHDMTIIDTYVLGQTNGGVQYGRTPVAQLDPLGYQIGVTATNQGVQDQTNVSFVGGFGAITANDTEASFQSLDTLPLNETVTLTSSGIYNGTFTVTSDDETGGQYFSDNVAYQNFRVSQNTYSVDGLGLHPTGTEQTATSTIAGGDNLVTYFNLFQPMNVTTIRVLLSSNTVVGAEVAGMVYEPVNGDLQYYDESSSVFISNQDIANGYVDFNYNTTLPAGEYYIGVVNYSFNDNFVGLVDRTIPQPNTTTLLYLSNQASWFFTEGAAAIRLITDDCPNLTTSILSSELACFDGLGGAVTVSAAGGTGPYTYSWSNGATGASLSNVAAGTYVVTVTENSGCTPKEFEIYVEPKPEMEFAVTTVSSTCAAIADGGATAVVQAGGVQPIAYTWSNGTQGPTINNVLAGVYTFDAVDDEGCLGEGMAIVPAGNVNYNVDFSADVTTGVAPQTIVFTNATPNLADFNFNWTYGDGDQEASNAATVNHVYSDVGTYTVQLEATNIATGCVDQLTQSNYIDIPTSVGLGELQLADFSIHPNPGNGKFTLARVYGQASFELKIFAANGVLIQESTHSEQNVQVDLSGLPIGIYFIQALADENVTLLRYVKH